MNLEGYHTGLPRCGGETPNLAETPKWIWQTCLKRVVCFWAAIMCRELHPFRNLHSSIVAKSRQIHACFSRLLPPFIPISGNI